MNAAVNARTAAPGAGAWPATSLADTLQPPCVALRLVEQDAVAAIEARSRGAATRLVGLSRIEEYQAIIAAPQSRVRRMRDARDCRIGLPSFGVSRSARAAALRGTLSALESQGLNHRHVEWVEISDASGEPHAAAFAAELQALQRQTADAVYVRGMAGVEAVRSMQARVLFDIGAQRDEWVRSQTALLTATVADAVLLKSRGASLEAKTLELAQVLKHFLLRWEFIADDFDLRGWTSA